MSESNLKFAVGDKAPELKLVLTRTDLVKYAGASGDFNPMHHDEIIATQAGQPSVFGHGMFSMGLLATALSNYVGIQNVKSFNVRFTKQTWPNEELVTKIEVTHVREQQDGAELELELALVAGSELKVAGKAVAFIPREG